MKEVRFLCFVCIDKIEKNKSRLYMRGQNTLVKNAETIDPYKLSPIRNALFEQSVSYFEQRGRSVV